MQNLPRMDLTTIQVKKFPHSLWLHVRARAALRNQRVRDFVIEALRAHLKATEPEAS